MSSFPRRPGFGEFRSDRRRRPAWFGALTCLILGGSIMTFAAAGCGEKALPAATHAVDGPAAPIKYASSAEKTVARAAAARPQPLRNITFDTVKLKITKGQPFHKELLTPQVKRLDGNRVRIRGYILPPPQQTGLSRFVLVRDNMACCFGPGAAIYDSMIVQMKSGLTMNYTVQPVMVEGTFSIHEVYLGDRCLSIYHVTADKAQ